MKRLVFAFTIPLMLISMIPRAEASWRSSFIKFPTLLPAPRAPATPVGAPAPRTQDFAGLRIALAQGDAVGVERGGLASHKHARKRIPRVP